MPKSVVLLICGLLLALGLTSCSGPLVRRVDPDEDDSLGGTGLDSGDLRAATSKMARALLSTPEIAGAMTPPIVVLQPVSNDTQYHIDSELFTLRIRAVLNSETSGKVRFIDRKTFAAQLEEKKLKEEGVYSSGERRQFKGADFFLTGEIKELAKSRDSKRSSYILCAFRLTDTETSEIVWEDIYEMKKEGEAGTLYR
ncbi:MAG: penicillin-binding protein activator LpoB [Planctomycetota bacterium]